ncbi:MAG: hypothetical protein JXQ72_03565 [Anaerolineae bacterium]|nr:hypothetical protein [Anaerolineae bacterium]
MRTMKWFVPVVMMVVIAVVLLLPGAALAQGGPLTPGVPVEGTLAGSPVSYTIDLGAGQVLSASLVSDAFDAILVVGDAAGTELARDDDGGEGTNSLLTFVAQTDGTYTLAAQSWSSDAAGAYTLTANIITPVKATVGETVILEPDGSGMLYAMFSGTANQVLNIYATSQADEDIRLVLYGVDGQELDNDDDDGPGYNPYLRRLVLPADGLYLVAISSYSDAIAGAAELGIESTERLYLSADPQTVFLNDEALSTEVFTFEVVAGTTYRMVITSESGDGIRLELGGTGEFFNPSLDVDTAARVSWDYQATFNGLLELIAHVSFFGDGGNYTFAVEPVQ